MSRLIIVAMLASACAGSSSVSRFRDVNGFPVPTWAAIDSTSHRVGLHCSDGHYWIVSDPLQSMGGSRGINGQLVRPMGDLDPRALCMKIEAY